MPWISKRIRITSRDTKTRDDYRMLNEFYKLKIQQVHSCGRICQFDGELSCSTAICSRLFPKWITGSLSQIFQGDRISLRYNVTWRHRNTSSYLGNCPKRQMEIISIRIHVALWSELVQWWEKRKSIDSQTGLPSATWRRETRTTPWCWHFRSIPQQNSNKEDSWNW